VLELCVDLLTVVRAFDVDLEACGGDMLGDDALERRRGVTLALEENDEFERGTVDAQHSVPVPSKGRLVKWSGEVDEETPRACVRAILGEFLYGVSPHPGLGALHARAPCSPQRYSGYSGHSTHDFYPEITEKPMEIYDVLGAWPRCYQRCRTCRVLGYLFCGGGERRADCRRGEGG